MESGRTRRLAARSYRKIRVGVELKDDDIVKAMGY